MTFLLLNQTFFPDLSATGQYLTDLALGLARKGHRVTVIASRRAYNSPATRFPKKELWQGIRVLRVFSTWFGKGTKWGRALDALSFLTCCALRLLVSARPDVVVALTSPPLIAFLAAGFAKTRRARMCYWVMDFNPDEAIAAGWLRSDSLSAKLLQRLSAFSLRHSTKIIALDRFMHERIVARGGARAKVSVLPLWSQDGSVNYDPAGRKRFRAEHGLTAKFVVMYSGNHSPCHPLDNLLRAAESLVSQPDICFCFVGGGSEWTRLQATRANVLFLPYQPLNRLSASLSAADLHVVVMGEPFVGLVHPCKVYNLLKMPAPLLYIGPAESHVTEIMRAGCRNAPAFLTASLCEVNKVVEHIRTQYAHPTRTNVTEPLSETVFSQEKILPRLIGLLESISPWDAADPGPG